jgi:nucleotide-binding universal stress UspA family protein
MKEIIVAVDGSDASNHALEMAADIASKFGAHLTTINVYTPPYLPPDPYAVSSGELEASVRKYGEDVARGAATVAQARGVRADWVAVSGAPAELIVDLAIEKDADLVVVGNRGRGAVKRALLGSVSSRLTHICNKPLLIVH